MSVRIDYDLDADALYVTLSDRGVAETLEIDEETHVDVDSAGRPTGIEVISFRRVWPLDRILDRFEIDDADAAVLREAFATGAGESAPRRA